MNTKAMEDAIKRLMKYCEMANKEVTQSIERRKLVMDIEMIYSGLIEIMEQRDAALKLAQKWERSERRFDRTGGNLEYYAYNGDRCAAELRAIFAPKEGK